MKQLLTIDRTQSIVYKFDFPSSINEKEVTCVDDNNDQQKEQLLVVTISSYQARSVDQLSIQVGDIIQLENMLENTSINEWCRGKVVKGVSQDKIGWFPIKYVKFLGKEYSLHLSSPSPLILLRNESFLNFDEQHTQSKSKITNQKISTNNTRFH